MTVKDFVDRIYECDGGFTIVLCDPSGEQTEYSDISEFEDRELDFGSVFIGFGEVKIYLQEE